MSAIPSYGWGYLAGSFTWLPQWTFLTPMTLNFLVLQGISDVFSASEISPKWLEISVEFSNIRYKEWWCRNNNSWVQSKIHWKTGPRHHSPLHHEFHHCTARADWLYGVVRIRVCQRLAFWSPMSWTWAAGVPWQGATTTKELMRWCSKFMLGRWYGKLAERVRVGKGQVNNVVCLKLESALEGLCFNPQWAEHGHSV